LREIFGVAAEEFVKRLAADDSDSVADKYESAKSGLIEKLGLSKADPQVIRVAETFALRATVGILASSDNYGVFAHNATGVEESIRAVFARWIEDRGGKKSAEDHAILDRVHGFLTRHGDRFRKGYDDERTITNRLGFSEAQSDKIVYYVIPKLFKEELCRGMSFKTVRNVLRAAEILEVDADGKDKRYSNPVDKSRTRMVCLIVRK
jgi:putative DNA primase/helicase